MAIEVTEQDKHLLDLVSKHEAKSYNTVYGGREIPLHQMLLAEVLKWQDDSVRAGARSSACGKYQFIKRTLDGAIRIIGVDPTQTRMTPDVQDGMIIGILKNSRQYNQFKAKSLGATELENAQKFCIKLAQEFASIPVPYDMQGARGSVRKGQSYYSGDGLNNAHHNPDTFVQALIDIRAGGPGETTKTVEINNGSAAGSNAYDPTGESPKAQLGNFAAGGGTQAGRRVDGNNTTPQRKGLPPADNVYVYEVIDPLDDRYDFRTGKKVTDITLYGTESVAAYNQRNSATAANTPASQLGVAPADGVKDLQNWTQEETNKLLETRDQVATQPGRYSDVFRDPYDPAALLTVPGRIPPAAIPGTTPNRAQPSNGLTGRTDPTLALPTPPVPGSNVIPNTVPGTIPQGSSTTQPTQEQTNKRDITFKLQKDLDKAKQDIRSTINAMNTVISNQSGVYGASLRIDLSTAKSELTAARASGNTTTIFVAEGKVNAIQSKLNLGSPYGLSTSERHRLASEDSEYIGLLSKLAVIVNTTIPNIVSQAKSLDIDLSQPNISSNLSLVPPSITFN